MKTVYIEGMMCMHCVGRVKAALEKIDGVTEVSVDLQSKKAEISCEKTLSDEQITNAVVEAGYSVEKIL